MMSVISKPVGGASRSSTLKRWKFTFFELCPYSRKPTICPLCRKIILKKLNNHQCGKLSDLSWCKSLAYIELLSIVMKCLLVAFSASQWLTYVSQASRPRSLHLYSIQSVFDFLNNVFLIKIVCIVYSAPSSAPLHYSSKAKPLPSDSHFGNTINSVPNIEVRNAQRIVSTSSRSEFRLWLLAPCFWSKRMARDGLWTNSHLQCKNNRNRSDLVHQLALS